MTKTKPSNHSFPQTRIPSSSRQINLSTAPDQRTPSWPNISKTNPVETTWRGFLLKRSTTSSKWGAKQKIFRKTRSRYTRSWPNSTNIQKRRKYRRACKPYRLISRSSALSLWGSAENQRGLWRGSSLTRHLPSPSLGTLTWFRLIFKPKSPPLSWVAIKNLQRNKFSPLQALNSILIKR